MAHKFTDTTGIQHLWKKLLKIINKIRTSTELLIYTTNYNVSLKADSADVYTKAETYTQSEINIKIASAIKDKAHLYQDTDLTLLGTYTEAETGVMAESSKYYLVLDTAGTYNAMHKGDSTSDTMIDALSSYYRLSHVWVGAYNNYFVAFRGMNKEIVVDTKDLPVKIYSVTYDKEIDVEDVYTNTYTKSEVDAKITSGGSFDSTLYYTKTETDDTFATLDSLATVATTGSYNDLTDLPAIITDVELATGTVPANQGETDTASIGIVVKYEDNLPYEMGGILCSKLLATTTQSGFMSPADKTKLDNTKAVSAGQGITISEDGTISCEWVPAKYYTGSTAPSSSVGSDNDLYLQIAE